MYDAEPSPMGHTYPSNVSTLYASSAATSLASPPAHRAQQVAGSAQRVELLQQSAEQRRQSARGERLPQRLPPRRGEEGGAQQGAPPLGARREQLAYGVRCRGLVPATPWLRACAHAGRLPQAQGTCPPRPPQALCAVSVLGGACKRGARLGVAVWPRAYMLKSSSAESAMPSSVTKERITRM